VDLEVVPSEGIGPVRLGMTPEEVRRASPVPVRSFKKTPFSKRPTDELEGLVLHVHYGESGTCAAVEAFPPSRVLLDGRALLGVAFGEVQGWLTSLDSSIELTDTGLTSRALGVGVFAPFAKKVPADPVRGVIVFVPGYYDRPRK
jgi:hypothetical protein